MGGEGSAHASAIGAAPAVNRSSSAPATSRAGNGSAASRLVSAGERKLPAGARDDQVAEPAAAQHRWLRHHADVREHRAHRGHPAAGVCQRRAVADVDRVDPGGRQRPAAALVNSTEVRWAGVRSPANTSATTTSNDAAGNCSSTARASPRRTPIRPVPGWARPTRQPPPDEPGHLRVGLDRQLPGAGTGSGHIARQRQPTGAEVQHPQRRAGRARPGRSGAPAAACIPGPGAADRQDRHVTARSRPPAASTNPAGPGRRAARPGRSSPAGPRPARCRPAAGWPWHHHPATGHLAGS